MPNRVPHYSKANCFQKRRDWKKYLTYFDESTIRIKDKFRKDKTGLKEAFYKKMGVHSEEAPRGDNLKVDISTRKLTFY